MGKKNHQRRHQNDDNDHGYHPDSHLLTPAPSRSSVSEPYTQLSQLFTHPPLGTTPRDPRFGPHPGDSYPAAQFFPQEPSTVGEGSFGGSIGDGRYVLDNRPQRPLRDDPTMLPPQTQDIAGGYQQQTDEPLAGNRAIEPDGDIAEDISSIQAISGSGQNSRVSTFDVRSGHETNETQDQSCLIDVGRWAQETLSREHTTWKGPRPPYQHYPATIEIGDDNMGRGINVPLGHFDFHAGYSQHQGITAGSSAPPGVFGHAEHSYGQSQVAEQSPQDDGAWGGGVNCAGHGDPPKKNKKEKKKKLPADRK